MQEYVAIQREQARSHVAQAWYIGNFAGAAFAGKLKRLSAYLKDDTPKAIQAPTISAEQMALLDKKFAERRQAHGTGEPTG